MGSSRPARGARFSALGLTLTLFGCGRVGYDVQAERASGDASAGAAGGRGAGGTAGGSSGGATASGGRSAGGSGGAGVPDAGSGGADPDGSLPDATRPDASPADAMPPDAPVGGCGNGVVDVGEECDDGAVSATCLATCRYSSCGDRVTNALAGEDCDDGDHLATCGITCQPPTCRLGCTCEWYAGHRYMLCPDRLQSTAAEQACQGSGMRVVRIDSGHEGSFLRLRTKQAGFSKFSIGASDTAAEGDFVWEDGQRFWSGGPAGAAVGGRFAFWAPGEPNDQNALEDCGEIQSIQGWNDARCDLEAKPFVCEQYRDPSAKCGNGVVDPGETCDEGNATPQCDADCSPVVCGDGLVNAAAGEVCDDGEQGQNCNPTCTQVICSPGCDCFLSNGRTYASCSAPLPFAEAEIACGGRGMALARVDDATEDQALRARMTTAGVGEFWLGGTDLDANGTWIWLDSAPLWSGNAGGTARGYAHFAATEPGGGAAENCLRVLASGEWSDADCVAPAAYVCERLSP